MATTATKPGRVKRKLLVGAAMVTVVALGGVALAAGNGSGAGATSKKTTSGGGAAPAEAASGQPLGTAMLSDIVEGAGTEAFKKEGFSYNKDDSPVVGCDFASETRSGDGFTCRYRLPDGRIDTVKAKIDGGWYRLIGTSVEQGAAVVLDAHSIGPARFGDRYDLAVAKLQTTIGKPDGDLVRYSSGGCPPPVTASWSWPSSALTIYFDANGGVAGYHYQGGAGPIGNLKTPEGIGVGSSVDELRRAYGQRLQAAQVAPGYWTFTADGTLKFGADGGAPTNKVLGIAAGSDCSFG